MGNRTCAEPSQTAPKACCRYSKSWNSIQSTPFMKSSITELGIFFTWFPKFWPEVSVTYTYENKPSIRNRPIFFLSLIFIFSSMPFSDLSLLNCSQLKGQNTTGVLPAEFANLTHLQEM